MRIHKVMFTKCQKYNRKFKMTLFGLTGLVRYPCVTDVPTSTLPLTLSLLVVAILLIIRTPKRCSQKAMTTAEVVTQE